MMTDGDNVVNNSLYDMKLAPLLASHVHREAQSISASKALLMEVISRRKSF